MYFSEVAKAFKKIEGESSRLAITHDLAELLKKANPEEAEMITCLSLGLLRATYKGTQFNFAEKNIVKVLAHILLTTEEDIKSQGKKTGDLGSIVAMGSWTPDKELTVHEVHHKLVAFEKLTGTGSQEVKAAALQELLMAVDPLSACYIVRMLVRKLRLGFSEMTIVDALSWAEVGDKSLRKGMEHAYNVSADIGLIARTLKEGGMEAVEEIAITVGIPIRPAAAERLATAAAIVEKIGPCVAQSKLDGFRLQVHVDKRSGKPEFHFYSRNMLDMSQMFPDLIEAVRDLPVKDLIVEGEALAYDDQTDSYLPFQETVKRRRKHDVDQMAIDMPLKLVLFDVLYLDGESWLEKTHKQRRDKLFELFAKHPHKALAVVDEVEITTGKQLEEFFVENIASGLEGLVVKKPDAPYQPGKRNFNWIKLKRQEEGHLDDTIDAVVLGYYDGKGKRASFGIGAFLVGLYNEKHDRFETVAKIGTGLTDAGWVELKTMCDRSKISKPLPNVICHKDLTPDVWVTPDIVVLVRADEITRSPVHASGKTDKELGLALRFPRIMGYRMDKSSTEATTATELQHLFELQNK